MQRICHQMTYFLSLLWENIGPLTCLLQPALSLAAVTASLQVAKPIFCLSPSTVLLHVIFGRPLVLFPSGAQVKAMRAFCWLFIRNTCPIQRQLSSPDLFADGSSSSLPPDLFI